jgi:protein-S-isoprenylcysteine O-methyltransferase Ste14
MNLTEIHISPYFVIFLVVFTIRNILEITIIPKPQSKGEGRSSLIIFSLLYFMVGISVGYNLWIANSVISLLFITGTIIFLSSHIIRILCIKKMGKSYSQLITPNSDFVLITSGIHSHIRHPLYFFYLLELLGLTIIKFNYIALATVVTDVLVTLIRIRNEEKLLIDKYGNEYIAYKKKTWKLIPFLC